MKNHTVSLDRSSQSLVDVALERSRQEAVEGWTPEHDDAHVNFALGKAAAAYLGEAIIQDKTRAEHAKRDFAPGVWPWDFSFWKPKDRRRDLVRAAALIVAEIDRLDRAAAVQATRPSAGPAGAPAAREAD